MHFEELSGRFIQYVCTHRHARKRFSADITLVRFLKLLGTRYMGNFCVCRYLQPNWEVIVHIFPSYAQSVTRVDYLDLFAQAYLIRMSQGTSSQVSCLLLNPILFQLNILCKTSYSTEFQLALRLL